jgi:hypothetical protein
MSKELSVLLKRHNVDLIQKADGTWALNGEREDMEAFQAGHKLLGQRYRRYRLGSYAALIILMLVVTIVILR